jgi:hypothetical protein
VKRPKGLGVAPSMGLVGAPGRGGTNPLPGMPAFFRTSPGTTVVRATAIFFITGIAADAVEAVLLGKTKENAGGGRGQIGKVSAAAKLTEKPTGNGEFLLSRKLQFVLDVRLETDLESAAA